jgi:hypothetical protein
MRRCGARGREPTLYHPGASGAIRGICAGLSSRASEASRGICTWQSDIAAPEFHAEHAEAAEERRAENCPRVAIAAPTLRSSPSTTFESLMAGQTDRSAPLRVLRGPRRDVASLGVPLHTLGVKTPCETKPEMQNGPGTPKRPGAVPPTHQLTNSAPHLALSSIRIRRRSSRRSCDGSNRSEASVRSIVVTASLTARR